MKIQVQQVLIASLIHSLFFKRTWSTFKKIILLSALTLFTASVAYSSSAGVDLVHHIFLVLQKNMDYLKETLFAVLLDVINCFPHIFKFYPIKGNNIPNRSTSRRLTVEGILAGDTSASSEELPLKSPADHVGNCLTAVSPSGMNQSMHPFFVIEANTVSLKKTRLLSALTSMLKLQVQQILIKLINHFLFFKRAWSALKKTLFLSVLTSLNSLLAYSSSACADSIHHTLQVQNNKQIRVLQNHLE